MDCLQLVDMVAWSGGSWGGMLLCCRRVVGLSVPGVGAAAACERNPMCTACPGTVDEQARGSWPGRWSWFLRGVPLGPCLSILVDDRQRKEEGMLGSWPWRCLEADQDEV